MTIINDTTATKPATAVTIITPETARRWLETNKINRPLNAKTVERYASDMRAGRWRFTHEGIGFDTNGDLSDGQHRLHAIAQQAEGFALAMNVTRGLAPEAKFFIDQGRKRTPGNQLAMAGIKNYNHTAAGTKFYLSWTTGLLFKDNAKLATITAPQIQEWVENHPGLVELANQSHTEIVGTDALPSVARAAFYRFAQVNVQDAVTFFHKLHTGAGLEAGNPILTLRNRFATIRKTGVMRNQRNELAYFVRAWNAWRAGKTLKTLGAKQWTPENFPQPR